MSWQQLVQPDLNAVGRVGWCLEYASRNVYHNPAGGSTAWNAWKSTQYPHNDRNLPNVPVFMWYSGAGGAGHVTINVPGQGIYSSPYNASYTHNVLGSIEQVEKYYGVSYVGWSEDCLGLRIAKEEQQVSASNDVVDETAVRQAYNAGLLRDPTQAEIDARVQGGNTLQQMQSSILASDEHKAIIAKVKDADAGVTVLKPGRYDVK